MRYTTGTTPPAIREPQLRVDLSAPATHLRRGVVALYLMEHYAALLAHVAQDLHELAKGQVADLSTPEPLHALQAKVFDAHEVEAVAEIVCGFEEPISTLPSNTPMGPCQTTTGRSAVARTVLLPAQIPVQSGDLLVRFTEELRRFNLTSIAQGEKNLQAEVHPHRVHYFLVWSWMGRRLDDTEAKPEITAAVSFDGDGFNRAGDFAAEHELESPASNAHPVRAEILPPGLRQREGGILRALFERRQTHPGPLVCLGVEVRLIGQVQPSDYHLSSLGADFIPVLEAALLLQLREMLLHLVVAWVLAVEPVVATRQGDEVIPDLGSVFDALDEHPVVPGSVETIFECSPQLRPKRTALAKTDRRVVGSHEQASGSMHPQGH